MKKKLIVSLFVLPIFIFLGFYFFQEKLIFKPTKLAENYEFQFDEKFEEINILGNNITEESVIRSQLEVDEGDPFNELLQAKSLNKIK